MWREETDPRSVSAANVHLVLAHQRAFLLYRNHSSGKGNL